MIVSQPTSGGVAVCVRDQAAEAVRSGFEVEVVCPGKESGPLAAWAVEAGATHREMSMSRTPALTDLFRVARLRRKLSQADIVHLHSSKAGALGRAASFLIRKPHRPPIVFTPHAWSWLVGGRMAPIYKFVERALFSRADRVIAVSEAEAAEGISVLGDSPRIIVINNGVDLSRFTPEGPAVTRSTHPLVVCVGRLAEQKGQDIAIRSLPAWNTEGVRLRLVGSGEAELGLRESAQSLGVADRVEWFPNSSEPATHFRAADVVLIPSRWEGQSLVLLEAMATGAPIVATAVGGTEVASDAAILIPPEDETAMATAIDQMLGDPTLRASLGRAARERAQNFSLARNLDLTLRVWEDLVQRHDQ